MKKNLFGRMRLLLPNWIILAACMCPSIVANAQSNFPVAHDPETVSGSLPTTTTSTTSTTTTMSVCQSQTVYRIDGSTRFDQISTDFSQSLFSGIVPSCLYQIASACGTHDYTIESVIEGHSTTAATSDDCMLGALFFGKVQNPGYVWWHTSFDPVNNNVPAGVSVYNLNCPQSYTRNRPCYFYDFTVYLDSSCNKVINPPYYCTMGNAYAIISPISFEWKSGAAAKDEGTLVDFPILPETKKLSYYWRASEEFPLLVYDPDHKGVIKDGRQLFGTRTFGKNWKNGYEALASMDMNADGKLNGKELRSLALWFDKNRDGVSQRGEVQSLGKLQVNAIYTGPVQDLGGEQDIVLEHGFERNTNGKLVIGKSVDWFAHIYRSKAEAAFDTKHFAPKNEEAASRERALTAELDERALTPATPWKGESLAGTWEWRLIGTKKEHSAENMKPAGVFRIQDKGHAEIEGYSLVELLETKASQHIVKGHYLFGKKYKERNGNTAVKFKVVTGKGSVTESVAHLAADGRTLLGKSHFPLYIEGNPDKTVKYRWMAKRL